MNLKLYSFKEEINDQLTNRKINEHNEILTDYESKINLLLIENNDLCHKINILEEKKEEDYFKIMRELSMIILSKNNSI
jgi:hypothetical protein